MKNSLTILLLFVFGSCSGQDSVSKFHLSVNTSAIQYALLVGAPKSSFEYDIVIYDTAKNIVAYQKRDSFFIVKDSLATITTLIHCLDWAGNFKMRLPKPVKYYKAKTMARLEAHHIYGNAVNAGEWQFAGETNDAGWWEEQVGYWIIPHKQNILYGVYITDKFEIVK